MYKRQVIQEAADMHQNVDYYGLSEIRFYKKTVVSVQSLGKLDDISFVAVSYTHLDVYKRQNGGRTRNSTDGIYLSDGYS